MTEEVLISSRPDRQVYKKLLSTGDFSVVPYEESRCNITVTNVSFTRDGKEQEIDGESRIFSKSFDGIVLIGDSISFLDRDVELILQHMCCGETSEARLVYKDGGREVALQVSCTISLLNVTEEQQICDWSWERLYSSALVHKEKGVELIKEKKILDAFNCFSKALKLVIAIVSQDPEAIDGDSFNQIIDTRVKLYSNLAHCQLQFNEYDAVLELCNKALSYHPDNIKSLYRRSIAYAHQQLYEEAWKDIQAVLKINPKDKAALQKANELRPKIDKINDDYKTVIKKMFG